MWKAVWYQIFGRSKIQCYRILLQHLTSLSLRYGPMEGHRIGARNPDVWNQARQTVAKRERVYNVLVEDFQGDKERFYAFFAAEPKRRKSGPPVARIRPFRLVVEAIPHCKKAIADEKDKVEYQDIQLTEFSLSLWSMRWGTKNDWEVWRELGKEKYGNA